MPTLYRLYRPQTFAEVTGQAHITATLEQAILKNRVSHAYLFQGPRGTGKTTTARILAKRLNCAKPKDAEPCGKCAVCKATQNNQNMDIIEIDAASNRGIDDIRALRENVGLSPSMGTYKIYIIDEVHMLTGEAFAALLKTLEEPVKHAVFILATTELHKVPPTILSRCQVFRFRRASNEQMHTRLEYLLKQEKREANDDVLQFIISRSDGCYRDAESLLGQILTTQEEKLSLSAVTQALGLPSPTVIDDFLATLAIQDAPAAIAIADKAHEDGFDPEQFIQECIRRARDGVLALSKQEKKLPSFAEHPQAAGQLPQIIRALIQAKQDIAYVPEPLIALQLAILTACPPQSAPAQTPLRPAGTQEVATARPQPQPQPAQQPIKTQPESVPAVAINSPPSTPSSAAVAVSKIIDAWPKLIEAVKPTNPVSSTFLRATEPVSCEGRQVTVRVQFALHRNFFEKPANKQLIEKTLSELLGTDLTIRCQLEENGQSIAQIQQVKRQQEEELLKNVQEVFGVKA